MRPESITVVPPICRPPLVISIPFPVSIEATLSVPTVPTASVPLFHKKKSIAFPTPS